MSRPSRRASRAWAIHPAERPRANRQKAAPGGSAEGAREGGQAEVEGRLLRRAGRARAPRGRRPGRRRPAGPGRPRSQQLGRARVAVRVERVAEAGQRAVVAERPLGRGAPRRRARRRGPGASTRSVSPPWRRPRSAQSAASTTCSRPASAEATQRAVKELTLSSWSAQRIERRLERGGLGRAPAPGQPLRQAAVARRPRRREQAGHHARGAAPRDRRRASRG